MRRHVWCGTAVVATVGLLAGGVARADDRASVARAVPAAGAPQRVYLQNLANARDPVAVRPVSGTQVQNLDPLQSARVTMDVIREGGEPPVTIVLPTVHPFGAYNVYLPTEAKLDPTGWFAATFTGDRALAAIARTEWPASGGAILFGSSLAGGNLVVPLVTRHYAGQTSVVRIQNTDSTQPASVVASVYELGRASPVVTLQPTIRAGGFTTVDLARLGDDARRLQPPPFVGWMRIASDVPVAASSYVAYDNGSPAVYGFEAVPADMAAERLFAPMVRNAFYGTTGISVVNPGPGDAQVTVRFVGAIGEISDPACVGRTFTQGPVTVAAGASALFYQAGVPIPGTGTSPLPPGCAGSATIEAAGGKVLAVVNDASGDPARPASSAAYNAPNAAQGAKMLALPLYRNQHTKAQLTTGIQAMNVGADTALVEIEFNLSTGLRVGGPSCRDCRQLIAPGAAYVWFPPAITELPVNVYGSAFITSDRPLAVIVNDAPLAGALDAAIYNGIKADGVSPDAP